MNLGKYKIITKNVNNIYEYYVVMDEFENKFFIKKIKSNNIDLIKLQNNEVEKYKYINKHNKSINIPNIISYGYNYIMYEYIEGIKLSELKDTEIKNVIMLFLKICEEVRKIHELNLVHCDLKLSNIIFKDDRVYIIDYGASVFVGEKVEYGSMIYCSVEHLRKKSSTFKFDIYALGVILYRMIESKMPYVEYEDINELLIKKRQNFPALQNINDNCISCINDLIQKMTTGNINIDEVIKELRQIIGVD